MHRNEAEILQKRSRLSPVKQALLMKRFSGEVDSNLQLNLIPRRLQNNPIPLSYAQERLWLLDQLASTSIYNMFTSVLFRGNLNVELLKRSFQEIIQRHEVLRTTFSTFDGQPIQVIASSTALALPIIDLQHLSADEQQQEVKSLITREQIQTFDLTKGSLLQVKLLRLAEAEHLMLLTIHHIVADAWSRGVFLQELATLYTAFSQGTSSCAELPIQYADYAIWQRQQLQGELLETQLTYWKQQLQGELPVLNLPTDRPRKTQTYKGASVSFNLPQTLTNSLQALSRQEGATLFITLLTAFKVLLHRYTGQDDILVGSPFANRNRPEVKNLIGFLVNTLVLRSDLSGNPSFRELLGRVGSVVLGAIAHQDLPFEKLLESLPSHGYSTGKPPFQVMFSLQNFLEVAQELPGVTLSFPEVENQTAFFDLVLSLQQKEQGLTAVLEYNTDLFNRNTIIRMLEHYHILLDSIINNPDQPIQHLPLLSEKATLEAWEQIECYYPQGKCLHQLFEAQVEQNPDAIALVFAEERLTYRELNQRANQLAHYLKTLRVENQAIGLYVERSTEMIVGILGILKACATYVPIDPTYPQQRLEFILEDAQIKLLLTQSQLVEKLTNSSSTQILTLDTFFASNTQLSVENLGLEVTADNTAYIIYTSGSTGTPKGVLCTHYNVVRLFQATQAWFNFDNKDVWTLFHSIAFDFSVWELWGALLHGGKAVIVPYWVSRSPEEFYELLASQQVTVLNQTPSAFRQLMRVSETVRDKKDLNLRYCIFGGEALELQSLKPWLERYGDQSPQLINMYGITETTVHVTYRRITKADMYNYSGSVIGRPIPDLLLLILDEHQQRVPIGIPGEMYVGGAGVACGYLNRSDLTASKFISHPFGNNSSNNPSTPLYRTGDLARYLANGDIEYLGRIDNQVKIRGFRIELGEIESLLATHPDVTEVAVIVREDTPGEKRIVAYVVPRQKHSEVTTNLRDFLQEKLPDYMAPSAFVILDTLPLTSNGKLDRLALPAPNYDRLDIAISSIAPRTPIEKVLGEIWGSLLNLEYIGIHDNFFEMGGHSLLATQLLSRVRQYFQADLPLKVIFTVGFTIAELAKVIREYQIQQIETEDIAALIQELNELSDTEVLLALKQLQ